MPLLLRHDGLPLTVSGSPMSATTRRMGCGSFTRQLEREVSRMLVLSLSMRLSSATLRCFNWRTSLKAGTLGETVRNPRGQLLPSASNYDCDLALEV